LQLESLVQQAQQKLARIQAKQLEEAPQAAELAADGDALEVEVQNLNRKQAVMLHDFRVHKEAVAAFGEKLKAAKQMLSQEKAAVALLRSQIVDDPEQLRRVISDMHHSVEREKESAAAAEEQLHAMQERANAMKQIELDIARANEFVHTVSAAVTRRDALAVEAGEYRQRLSDTENALREQTAAKQNVQYSLDTHDDKMRRLKETHATRRAEAQSMLRECRTEKMESDKQRLVVATKINQQEINAKQLYAKIAHTHQEHMAEIASMRQRVDELEQSLHTYHHQLVVAISQTAK